MKIELDREKSKELFDRFTALSFHIRNWGSVVQNPDYASQEELKIFLSFYEQIQNQINILVEDVQELYSESAPSYLFYTVQQNNSGGYFINNEDVAEYLIIEAMNEDQFEERLNLITDKYSEYCPCCGTRWNVWDDEGNIAPMIYGELVEDYINSKRNLHDKEAIIHYLDGTTRKITKGGY